METTKEDYGPDFTDYLIDFISKISHNHFCLLSMLLVHSPFVATPDSNSDHQGSEPKSKIFP